MPDSLTTSIESIVGPLPWEGSLPPQAQSLPELLEAIAVAQPSSPALVVGDVRRSYRELADRVDAFAAGLASLGVTAQTKVALLAPNTEEWLVAAFGAMRLGVSLHTFHTWVHAWDLEYLLGAADTEVLITVPQVRSNDILAELRTLVPEAWCESVEKNKKFPSLRSIILIGETQTDTPPPMDSIDFGHLMADHAASPVPPVSAQGDGTALVLYTSGTTEFPKAVPLQHRDLIENGFAIGERMGLGTDERVWLGSPLFWSFGIANAVMATMTHAGCLVVQGRFSPLDAAAEMARERCTAAYLLPSIALTLIEDAREEISSITSLRTGVIIGRPEEVERAISELNIPELCNVYGSTELYGNCCVTPHTLNRVTRANFQGPPLPGFELRIVDTNTGDILPRDTAGELQVRGRVMSGYLNNAEATSGAMSRDGWYRTGDIALLSADGMMQFLSRESEMIKTSGINVSPLEVEAFISQIDGVEEVVVVGAPHPDRGEVPVAFVVARDHAQVSGSTVIENCKQSIASFKVPWAVEIIADIPKTTTGKVTRKALAGLAAEAVQARLIETRG